MSGFEAYQVGITCYATGYYYQQSDEGISQHVIEDFSWRTTSTSRGTFASMGVPREGLLIQRGNVFRGSIGLYVRAYYSSTWKSGTAEITNCNQVSCYSTPFLGSATDNNITKFNVHDNRFEHSYTTAYSAIYFCGIGSTFKNNYFWGCGRAVNVQQCINALDISANTYENCTNGICFENAVSKSCIDKSSVFGQSFVNTSDITLLAGALIDYEISSPVGNLTIDITQQKDMTAGSQLKITNENGTTNKDSDYLGYGSFVRTGDGLADTTARTIGSGKFAMRLRPNDPAAVLGWSQIIPTGNIQNKTMMVSAWVKINSANYYAGTHINPTLRVTYDTSTDITSVASNSTGWQQISLTFTPATSSGQITFQIEGATGAASTDADFYIDDINVSYPSGVAIDLGGIDLWAHAEPVKPTIATMPSLAGIWDELLTSHTISGSFGMFIKKLLTFFAARRESFKSDIAK